MRIIFLSDTHNCLNYIKVPDGDLLIHCGDSTMQGTIDELKRFNAALERLPHQHKVVIAGNHEFIFESQPDVGRSLLTAATYLQDESVTISGVKIYGSPWQPEFGGWAFNLPRNSPAITKVWDKIPGDTDILVTHGPPFGILDKTAGGDPVGCEVLRDRLKDIHPRIHCFGHIHHSYGEKVVSGTLFINAANANEMYQPINEPIIFDWP
jgi:Icc-related predicted phosphoesterase